MLGVDDSEVRGWVSAVVCFFLFTGIVLSLWEFKGCDLHDHTMPVLSLQFIPFGLASQLYTTLGMASEQPDWYSTPYDRGHSGEA
jgi:glucose-6-phosphate-specific signal transduction histidine kinase